MRSSRSETTGQCVHVNLTPELGKRLREWHFETGVAKTALIKNLVKRYLDARDNGEKQIMVKW